MFDRLMKKAGFVFWQSDEMGTGVDWSSDYSQEMKKYNKLLIEEVAQFVEWAHKHSLPSEEYGHLIRTHFSN